MLDDRSIKALTLLTAALVLSACSGSGTDDLATINPITGANTDSVVPDFVFADTIGDDVIDAIEDDPNTTDPIDFDLIDPIDINKPADSLDIRQTLSLAQTKAIEAVLQVSGFYETEITGERPLFSEVNESIPTVMDENLTVFDTTNTFINIDGTGNGSFNSTQEIEHNESDQTFIERTGDRTVSDNVVTWAGIFNWSRRTSINSVSVNFRTETRQNQLTQSETYEQSGVVTNFNTLGSTNFERVDVTYTVEGTVAIPLIQDEEAGDTDFCTIDVGTIEATFPASGLATTITKTVDEQNWNVTEFDNSGGVIARYQVISLSENAQNNLFYCAFSELM